jgi:F-type H+-transporting ATPase subunit epsilon
MAFTLEIITPERVAYRDTVESVVLPTTNGEVGILPGHIPLLTTVVAGELQIYKNNQPFSLAVDKGFARVSGDVVSVLTEAAVDIHAIDFAAVEAAQEKAQKALEEARHHHDVDPVEVEKLESIVRFSLAQKLIRNRHY